MAYDGENINRREEMLSRFRESLTRPLSERYFDEDELIEIFDFAGDIGDDYLRIEAMMCASRFYPDSEPMRERKAIFYAQYSADASEKYIDDNSGSGGMLWDIMRAHRADPQDEETKQSILNTIVDSYDNFSDEEVIQLIELVSHFGQMEWLKANMDKLRSKVEYANILLYEVAVMADSHQDVRLSVKMLEELTEEEPYNLYFWLMLSREYASLDEGEKALNAIDYALAINPDDEQSLFTKAKLLYVNERPPEEIIELLKKLLSKNPNLPEAIRLLASVYSDTGNKILAGATLNEYASKFPKDAAGIIPDLILYRPANMAELLDRFYESNEENSQIVWASWAHQLSQCGYSDIGEEVLKAYRRNSGEQIFTLFPIENLFVQQRFSEAMEAMCEYLENSENSEFEFPTMIVMHVLSMIKLGEYDKAMDFCNFFEKNSNINRASTISGRLELIGLTKIIRQIKNRLKRTTDPSDWEDYDPLSLWDS